MENKIDTSDIEAILSALKLPYRAPRSLGISNSIAILESEWICAQDLEDILFECDPRPIDRLKGLPVKRLCQVFGIEMQSVFPKPKTKSKGVIGGPKISATDAIKILIQLERLGFLTSPIGLVDWYLPKIESKKMITDSELMIFWYQDLLNRNPPFALFASGADKFASRSDEVITESGYRLEVWRDINGKAYHLIANSPKYRRPRKIVETTCDVCGFKWMKGDVDSSKSHRREHKKRLRYLNPQPIAWELSRHDLCDGLVQIRSRSSSRLHAEIYLRALAFRREFEYDFVQWGGPKGDKDKNANGFLFVDGNNLIIGACSFRLREDGEKKYWALQWIWITPKFRRQGVLASRWPALRKVFGDFYVEGPVSDAMICFLEKAGDARLASWSEFKKLV